MAPATDSRMSSGCTSTALPMRIGLSTFASSCCTRMHTSSISSATPGPWNASAIATATALETTAPTKGMKHRMNVIAMIGITNGTPRRRAPRPMPAASTAATSSWVRQ